MIQLSISDINTLMDALSRGAARHESLAAALKPGGRYAGKHDCAAAAMRGLRGRLLRAKTEHLRRPITVEMR